MALPASQNPPDTSPPGRRLAGVASFNLDGNYYDIVGDLEWSPSSFNRESQIGLNGVHGFSERFKPGYISATLRDTYGTSVTNMNTLRAVNCSVHLANGKTVTVNNGWSVEVQEVHSDEATFRIRLESDSVTETQGGTGLLTPNTGGATVSSGVPGA